MSFVRGGSRIAMLASYYVVHDVHAVRQRIFFATRAPLRYCSSLALTTSRLLWSHGRVRRGRCCRRRGSCTYEQGWLAASQCYTTCSTVFHCAAAGCQCVLHASTWCTTWPRSLAVVMGRLGRGGGTIITDCKARAGRATRDGFSTSPGGAIPLDGAWC